MDTITSSSTGKVEMLFQDGDTRNLNFKNPNKTTFNQTNVLGLETLILNGGTSTLLIGDKTGSPFRRIEKASIINKTTTTLDIR